MMTNANGSDPTPVAVAMAEAVHSLGLGKPTTQMRPLLASRTPEELAAFERNRAEEKQRQLKQSRMNTWERLIGYIGKRYAESRLANFQADTEAQKSVVAQLNKFCDEIEDRTQAGQGIVLSGPRGTGKDHLAVACLRAAVLFHGIRADWIDGQCLYREFRDNIDSENKEIQLIRQYTAPTILLISDPVPATESLTAFQQSTLWSIIDQRYRNMNPTWVTMNVGSSEEAEKRLGAQIVDRLREGALALVCNWPSYRKSATTR